MYVRRPYASLTLNLATPLELALTPFSDGTLQGVVASTTAEQITTIDVWRSPVAHSSLCAQGPNFIVFDAIVWGILQVDEVVCCRNG